MSTANLSFPGASSLESAALKGWHARELETAWRDLHLTMLEVARLERHAFDGRLARAVDAVATILAAMQGLDEYGRTPAEAKAARAALARLPRTEGEEDNQEPEDES
jgi:hypothetical protein